MKSKKLALALSVLGSMVFCTGCGPENFTQKDYSFYTNMPEYEILDKHFVAAGKIDGYTAPDRSFEEIDTANYSSRRMIAFFMTADVEMIVSDDFTADGAEERYDGFVTEVRSTLNEIDKALSSTVTGSDIDKFNKAAAGEKLEIRGVTYEVLSEALAVYNLTDGYYNPALYYNIIEYGFGGGKRPSSKSDLPSDEKIEKYRELSAHFGETKLSEEEGKFYAQKPAATVEIDGVMYSMKLDLGGIGKGYAVDVVDKLFDKYGYKFGYFNFGASSMLVKSNVANGAYNLQFINPRSLTRDSYLQTAVRGEKLSTSGDGEQYYMIDGVRYCHVIDPTTGKPVQTGIMSATVIGGSAARADALTTAIMAMGKERAVQFVGEKLGEYRVVFACE